MQIVGTNLRNYSINCLYTIGRQYVKNTLTTEYRYSDWCKILASTDGPVTQGSATIIMNFTLGHIGNNLSAMPEKKNSIAMCRIRT